MQRQNLETNGVRMKDPLWSVNPRPLEVEPYSLVINDYRGTAFTLKREARHIMKIHRHNDSTAKMIYQCRDVSLTLDVFSGIQGSHHMEDVGNSDSLQTLENNAQFVSLFLLDLALETRVARFPYRAASLGMVRAHY